MKRLIWNTVTVSFFLYPLKYIEISIANAVFNTGPLMVFFVEAIYFQVNYVSI